MKTRFLSALSAVVLAFAPALLPGPALGAGPSDRVVIGGTIGLSGRFAKEGEQSVWGIRAMEKWTNKVVGGVMVKGRAIPVEYRYYDDESRKEAVISLAERLITADKVRFFLAPYSSPLTLAGAPVADKHEVLYMSHGGATDRVVEQGYRYVVQTLSPASMYQTSFLDMVRQLDPGAKRLALLFKDDEFSREVMKGVQAHAGKTGFSIVFSRTYPSEVKDLTPVLTELQAAKADVLAGGGHFADGQLLTRQLADMRIDLRAASILVAPAIPAFYQALGGVAESIVSPGQWGIGATYSPEAARKRGIDYVGPTQTEFMDLFLAESKGVSPSYHAAEAAAGFLAVVKGITEAASLDPKVVRQVMNRLHFMTFFGDWKIEPDTGRQIGHEMVLLQWQRKKLEIVWPPSAQTSKPVYPMLTTRQREAGQLAVPR